MKTKKEVEAVGEQPEELSDEDLEKVTGGASFTWKTVTPAAQNLETVTGGALWTMGTPDGQNPETIIAGGDLASKLQDLETASLLGTTL